MTESKQEKQNKKLNVHILEVGVCISWSEHTQQLNHLHVRIASGCLIKIIIFLTIWLFNEVAYIYVFS